jgi:ceramide glucosyltransferase
LTPLALVAAGLAGATVASWIYQVAAVLAVRGLRRERIPAPTALPPVSVLVPVSGPEAGALQNFSSLAGQDYPELEILFAAQDATDPALADAEALRRAFPHRAIRTLVVAPTQAGNPKVALLAAMAHAARYEHLLACDSDVRLTPATLQTMVAELGEPGIGLVSAPYVAAGARSGAAVFEALGIGLGFLPSAVLAQRWLGLGFALGAANILRRAQLQAIGGFEALADVLADDHELGVRIAASGRKVRLSTKIVRTVLGATSWRALWQREVRWARTIRASRPLHYPGILLTLPTPLAALTVAASAAAPWSVVLLAGSLALRWLAGLTLTALTGERGLRDGLWRLPARDALSAAVWVAGVAGRKVVWRGRRLTLDERGRIRAVAAAIDRRLRRTQGIFEISHDARCLLRVSVHHVERETLLPDGTRLPPGARIAELHLWNERLQQAPLDSLARARAVAENARCSLELLAAALKSDPRLQGVEAFACETILSGLARLLSHWGFEPEAAPAPARLADLGRSLHMRMLAVAYNPGALLSRRELRRSRLWLSRSELLRRYAREDRAARETAALPG